MIPKLNWMPDGRDYAQILIEQNPWWTTGVVPSVLAKPIERPLAEGLYQRITQYDPERYQLIIGPRRVGKTTCMYQVIKRLLESGVPRERVKWLRLDHPLLMDIPMGYLIDLLTTSPKTSECSYLFLDELTYSSQWDKWLKTFYDERWPVRIIGTSSSTAALRTGRIESGIGRWEEQYLPPYSFSEYLNLLDANYDIPVQNTLSQTFTAINPDISQIIALAPFRERYLFTGGFPELLLSQSLEIEQENAIIRSQQILKSDAVERAIYKDIPQVFRVDNPRLLERLLYTLAGSITGILSPAKLKTQLEMSQPTFDRYLNFLEQSYLVFTLQNYSGREASKQARGRKLYFVDGAVRNAALQRGIMPLSSPEEMGILLENLLAGQLYSLSRQSDSRLYYWRDGNSEVDFIYDHPTEPIAIEIGSSKQHKRSGLIALQNRYNRFRNRCYLTAPDAPYVRPDESDGIGSIPLDLLLLIAGKQAQSALKNKLNWK